MGNYFEKKNSTSIKNASLRGISEEQKRNPIPEKIANCKEYLFSVQVEYESSLDDAKKPNLSKGFMKLSIFSKFDTAMFPDIILECFVSDVDFKNMQDDYRKATIRITITRSYRKELKKFGKIEEIWSKKAFKISDISSGIIPKDTIDKNPADEDMNRAAIPVRLTLISTATLEVYKTINNFIFNDAKMADVLEFLVGKVCPKGKVSAQLPDNTDTYEQVFVPASNIFSTIEYLDDTYGIYSHGVTVFSNVDDLIILSKIKPNVNPKSAMTEIDVCLFQNNEPTEKGSLGCTYVNEEEKKLEIFYGLNPAIHINDIFNKLNTGKDITIASRDASFSPAGGAGIESDKLFDRQSYCWLNSSSKFADKKIELSISESSEVIEMVIPGTIFEEFTPKLLVNLRAVNETALDYKGQYRIARNLTVFQASEKDIGTDPETESNSDEKTFRSFMAACSTTVVLYKIR